MKQTYNIVCMNTKAIYSKWQGNWVKGGKALEKKILLK